MSEGAFINYKMGANKHGGSTSFGSNLGGINLAPGGGGEIKHFQTSLQTFCHYMAFSRQMYAILIPS